MSFIEIEFYNLDIIHVIYKSQKLFITIQKVNSKDMICHLPIQVLHEVLAAQ